MNNKLIKQAFDNGLKEGLFKEAWKWEDIAAKGGSIGMWANALKPIAAKTFIGKSLLPLIPGLGVVASPWVWGPLLVASAAYSGYKGYQGYKGKAKDIKKYKAKISAQAKIQNKLIQEAIRKRENIKFQEEGLKYLPTAPKTHEEMIGRFTSQKGLENLPVDYESIIAGLAKKGL